VTERWPQRARRSTTIHWGVFTCVLTLRTIRPEKRPHRSVASILTGSLSARPRPQRERQGFRAACRSAPTARAPRRRRSGSAPDWA
jgi:hypothetical protein